jgi:DNA polymerase III epsilon subunit-like protein
MSVQSLLACEAVFTVVDFETTGAVSGWPVEPWQVGMVAVRSGSVVAGERFEALLRVSPERPFNPRAPGRHAQLRPELAQALTLAERWPEIAAWTVSRPLVAHNIGTERAVLARAAPLHRFGPWIDTLRLVRKAWPRLASAALADVVVGLGLGERVSALCPGRGAHDALYDAVACGLLLEHLLAQPGWEQVTVRALVELR